MACACKVNQQISYIQKKYGVKQPTSRKSNISFNIKMKVKEAFFLLLAILLSPLMLLHILYKTIFTKDKTIDIKKLFRLKAAN